MKFGVHTGLQNTSTDELQALWRRIEDHGFELDLDLGPLLRGADVTPASRHCLEAVASARRARAMTTSSVRVRQPRVLASATGIRRCSRTRWPPSTSSRDGRVTLGLGAGWHQAEYDAYGIPFPPAPVRLRQVDEAIQCIRGLLTEDVANFDGEFFQLRDARCEPKPVQARLPLWIGGGGEKVTLKLVARHADGWNVPFVAPEVYAHKVQVLARALRATSGAIPRRSRVHREPRVGVERRRPRGAVRRHRAGGASQRAHGQRARGDRPHRRVRRRGCVQVILALRAPFDADGLDRFAAEVLPAFR